MADESKEKKHAREFNPVTAGINAAEILQIQDFARQKAQFDRRVREVEQQYKERHEELLQRESSLRKELAHMEALFHEREKTLMEQQHHLMQRQAASDALRAKLQEEITQREVKLEQALAELQQEKERYNEESRKRLEKTSRDYVAEVLEVLDRKERQFHSLSKAWAYGGAIALLLATAFFVATTYLIASKMPEHVSWQFIIFSLFKGFVPAALLIGLARYSFLYSNAYMREALKNADRTHAINFGKFYLQSYGAAADWSQVKEAFANWNISNSNAFVANEKIDTDLTAVESAASLVERVARALPKLKAGEGS